MKETEQLKKLMEAIDAPFMQAHNLSDDSIFDQYKAGNISYEEAEQQLKQIHKNPDDLELAMNTLNTYYGDTEVDWDEESGGGIAKEDRQPLGDTRLPYDIEFDNEDITIFTLGGKPVLEMQLDDWMALISKFNRMMGSKQGPGRY